ncbi:hypothetical protein [Brevibacterium moorei]|uniref:hypothetical protein n=1 Tax=Brevibacterium moorei TaxID=2968457 RepID=UPI00211CD7D2|nr:hypothetical protein [Brevibacterium sp. 68QC2CO]MCQ9385133.1 hypothetical protein [Brevibacterium sp. 68QC2CO]
MLITDGVLVEYHNNVIAHILNRSRFQDVLGFGLVPVHTTLSTAGWNSVTTAGRLDQLLSASGAPGRIGITKGRTVYRTHGRELPFDQLYIGPDEIYARNGNATTRVDY